VSEKEMSDLLIGDSLIMRRLRALVARVAASTLPALIEGETGSGKELVARALHEWSG
jgi:DNA-binding NtrC family response regulator